MTALSKQELQLIDGGKDIRDKYISKTEVLDRVKELSLLPYEESATTEMVAEYYNVAINTVYSLVKDNKVELDEDGYESLTGSQLTSFKKVCQIKSRARSIAIFPRRAILRVGMLLRDSEVAKEVRTYLLNVEGSTSESSKQMSLTITEKDLLILKIVKAKDETGRAVALSEFNSYVEKVELENEEMKPKAENYDTFMNGDNYQKMNVVAKALGYGRNKLFKFLRDKKVLMGDNTPYQRFIESGYFVVKEKPIKMGDENINKPQTFVTAKGVEYINKLLNESKVIRIK